MTKKILLLGGSGYLGTSIAKMFENIIDFDLTIGDLVEPLVLKQKFIKIDVLDKECVNFQIQNYDLIINCTGQITSPIKVCFDINTMGIENIVDAVNLYKKKIFHISTVAIYGTCKYADEMNPINPESSYAALKAFAEYKIKSTLTSEKYCILRLANLYGEDQKKGLFAYLLKASLSGEKLQFNNDGSLERYFIHVNDCANAISSSVVLNLFGTYNVATNDKYTVNQIISLIEQVCNSKFITEFNTIKPIENIDDLNFDCFKQICKFEPKMELTNFIKKTFSKYE
jgi:nucleoside-diphosphate-sugar epimerase